MGIRRRSTAMGPYTSYGDVSLDIDGKADQSSVTLYEHQITRSNGNNVRELGRGNWIGGDFYTQRCWITPPEKLPILSQYANDRKNRWADDYAFAAPVPRLFTSGSFVDSDLYLYSQAPSALVLVGYGGTAIANTTPTNSIASVAASLGELREGLPAIPGRSALRGGSHGKNIADDYLNLEFGIKPIAGDIAKYRKAAKEADKRLKQLYRDSNRKVRRRYRFPQQHSQSVKLETKQVPWMPHASFYTVDTDYPSKLTTTTEVSTDIWFSGAYTYFFPKQEGYHQRMAELEKTYGVSPDVEDVYQLAPWSWALDWVSNYGDLVHNVKAFSSDSLVLNYGYVMARTRVTTTQVWRGPLKVNGSWQVREIRTSYGSETKQRVAASPFGFGLNTEAFSTRQKAIIAALSVSKFSR